MFTILAQVLADTAGWRHMSGWGWMMFGWFFMAVLVGLVIWAFARTPRSDSSRPTPMEVLEERFARGDISAEEFQERRDALENRKTK